MLVKELIGTLRRFPRWMGALKAYLWWYLVYRPRGWFSVKLFAFFRWLIKELFGGTYVVVNRLLIVDNLCPFLNCSWEMDGNTVFLYELSRQEIEKLRSLGWWDKRWFLYQIGAELGVEFVYKRGEDLFFIEGGGIVNGQEGKSSG
jgi:hypothetical protein